MLIVYRKSDKAIASNSGTNSLLLNGPELSAEVQNAINKLGGSADDYDEYRLNDVEDAAQVQAIIAAGSYELTFTDGEPTGVITYPRIAATADKLQITADELDAATITANVGDPANTGDVEFYVDGQLVGNDSAVAGVATMQFTATSPGQYVIEAVSLTPGPPGFEYRHGSASIVVEAIE